MEGSVETQRTCKNNGIGGSASFTHISVEGQGMVNSSGYEYEVFLSFRGNDTRAGFTSFLYTSMIDVGIRVYKDDKELRKGKKFGPELLQAINQSKISIPIFSKGYASSIWCLKELVEMIECQKTRGQKIMPIFYDVAPSEVRYQTGAYVEAFLSHEKKQRYDEKTMCQWKAALSAVGAINGWDLHNKTNREEGQITKTVNQKVFNELKKAYLVVSNNLVSVDLHVDKIMEKIGAHTSKTRIIGIHGMGGVGKTTIAKIIYNELSNKYDSHCFLSNIRETSKLKGIEYLQQQLISDVLKTKWMDIRNIDEGIKTIKDRLPNKKVLLLLDDVEEKDHMDALVGKRDWFGAGSKLIITTRRKDVLCVPEVDWRYELTGLDQNLSLQLFSKHAFRRDHPLDEYINQSKRAIHIAGGLPLALEVIGALLSGKNKEMWDYTLKMLESVPHDEVQKKVLLWHKWPSNVLPTNVFQKNTSLLPQLRWLSWHNICPTFKIANFSMENLIILDLSQSEITHDWKGWSHMKVMKNLKVLDLANCQCLKRTPNFFAHSNLERLILSRCESLMEIDRSICQLKRLVLLDVSYCWYLQRLPTELGGLARLKYLSLRNCESLKRLPSTIGNLKVLTKLDISCMSIKELPDSIGKLKNLKVVKLQESDISKIHDAFWMMKKLEKIKIVGKKYPFESFYVEIGDCIYKNKSLRILGLGQVRIHAIPRLPKSLIELKLWELHMDTCPDISNLTNLKVLYLSFRPRNCDGKSNGLREEPIPRWIGNLSKLESLTLLFHWETPSWTDCYLSHPRRLPRLPPSLSSIRVEGCDSPCSMDLSNLRKLSSLWISHSAVAEIQGLGCLKNLRDLVLHHLKLAMLPDLSKLNKLRLIRVRECGNLVEIQGELPRFLDRLEIYLSPFLQQLPDLFSLMGKTDVEISWCNQVLEDAVMDRHRLLLRGFRQMQILPDLSNLNELKFLQVENCGNLVEI